MKRYVSGMNVLVFKVGALFALVFALGALASAGLAITIQPGVYSLHWQAPGEGGSIVYLDFGSSFERLGAPELARFTQLKSENARFGVFGKYLVFIDESKGTDTGFDTGYFMDVPAGMNMELVDLSKASSFGVSQEGNNIQSQESRPGSREWAGPAPLVNVKFGPAGEEVMRPLAIFLDVYIRPAQDTTAGKQSNDRWGANAQLFGGWFGTVKTDIGPLKIQAVDRNQNGVFADHAVPHKPFERGCADGLAIPEDRIAPAYQFHALGKAVSYQGKNYSVRINPVGDTVEITPYTGPLGKIKVDARDGHGKPAELYFATFDGEGGTYTIGSGKSIDLPPGNYICEEAGVLANATNPNGKGLRRLTVKPPSPTVVTEGKVTTLAIGGPLHLEFQSKPTDFVMKAGAEKKFPLRIAPGEGRVMIAWSREGSLCLSVKDSKGKVVSTSSRYPSLSVWNASVRVPANCAPGSYRLVATFDPKPYQSPLRVEKTLRIVR
jgi:hypothetical protein